MLFNSNPFFFTFIKIDNVRLTVIDVFLGIVNQPPFSYAVVDLLWSGGKPLVYCQLYCN